MYQKLENSNTGSKDKLKILVMVYFQELSERMKFYLEGEGYETVTANTPAAGLTFLLEQAFDLVFVDVLLPGANGIEILKDIKEEYPRVEVIIVCHFGDMELAIKSFRLGALDYLKIPFYESELKVALDRAEKIIKKKNLRINHTI